MNRFWYLILFLSAALFLSWHYSYLDLLLMPPAGTHVWRQTDSASFAWSYWQNGLDFFRPEIMNKSKGNGFAVSEFPLFQYLTAILYSIFGFHNFFQKAIHVLIYFFGLYALFYIAANYLKNTFNALLLALLFFTAPTLVFYANNYIPDALALSCAYIGYAFYLKSKKSTSIKWGVYSVIAFCLSGLFKVSYLMPLLAIIFTELTEIFFNKNNLNASFAYKKIVAIVVIFSVVGIWIYTMKNYNNINDNIYFLSSTNPIWGEGTDISLRGYIFKRTFSDWANNFFHYTINYSLLISLFLLPVSFIKGNKTLSLITTYLLLGTISYYLLWYGQFLHHDYYTIPAYSLFFFSLLNFFVLVEIFAAHYIKLLFSTVLIAFICINAAHTKTNLNEKLYGKQKDAWNNDLWDKELVPYIRSIGIQQADLIISIPDISPQVSLYMLQNSGFTEFAEGNYDLNKINSIKKEGAKYLIINDSSKYLELQSQLENKIGEYKTVKIYKL